MRARFRIALAAAGLFLLFAGRVVFWRGFDVAGAPPADGYTRIAGVIHAHTTFSDGEGTPEGLLAGAQAAHLGFLAITDHNVLDAKPLEGYHGGLLVVVGTEVSTTAGHVVGLGIPDPGFRFSGDGLDALEDIHDLGGAAFAAHPLSANPDLRWRGWDLPGGWGMEILNGDSQWRAAGWPRLARAYALSALNPRYALLTILTPPEDALRRWDAILSERACPGIAGTDAHGRVGDFRRHSLPFPSYASVFAVLQNHVLLDHPLPAEGDQAVHRLVEALSLGHSYVALDSLAPAGGFSFTAQAAGKTWTMGDSLETAPGITLSAGGALPPAARLTLLCNGRKVKEGSAHLELPDAPPGIYRVEVALPGWSVPWILANPITILDAGELRARAARGMLPSPPAAAEPREVLDKFERDSIFAAEHDSFSDQGEVLAAQKGIGGSGAGRLECRLGVPTAAHPHTWCALVNRQSRDFSKDQGLVLSVRGEGVYRFFVQLRDENPQSADDGLEWWSQSVRTSTQWRRVALPFGRFRSINPKTSGHLGKDKIRAIVLLLDSGAMKPGSHETIFVDDLGVY